MAGTIFIGIDVESVDISSANYARLGVDMLEKERVPASWYVTGSTLEKYPDLFVKADASGLIDLQMHTYNHILLKTVLIQVPAGRTIHGKSDWCLVRGSSNEEIDVDLRHCQQVFRDVLGRPALGLTCPYGYYRGLADRPDILEIVHAHGIRYLRSFGRNETDGQPVPLEWKPFWYSVQGFPGILELMAHDYQDDFYFAQFNGLKDASTYPAHLRQVAEQVAGRDLVWSLCSHDHHCETPDAFHNKTAWLVDIIKYAKSLGIRFVTAKEFYEEQIKAEKEKQSLHRRE